VIKAAAVSDDGGRFFLRAYFDLSSSLFVYAFKSIVYGIIQRLISVEGFPND
jgi:hypothetical protein